MYGCFHLSFWFIFDQLCTNHYRTSLMVFFSPFNACFLLLTTHVHSFATCVSHNDSLTGCCTWWGFFIFSARHS
jgi:hypothetical protein